MVEIVETPQRKARRQWDTEKPELHAARRLRGIYHIDSDDKEFDNIMKNWKRIWNPPCEKTPKNRHNSLSTIQSGLCSETQLEETSCIKDHKKPNTVDAHKIDAYESRRYGTCAKHTPQNDYLTIRFIGRCLCQKQCEFQKRTWQWISLQRP